MYVFKEKCVNLASYKTNCISFLAQTGSFFLGSNLVLKDGRPTPYFVNLGMFSRANELSSLSSIFAEMLTMEDWADTSDIIIGPSFKGSSLACATTLALYRDHGKNLRYDYDRVYPKEHGETSLKKSFFVNQAMFNHCKLFIVDDVATSMTTKYELLEKIEAHATLHNLSYQITGMGIIVDRQQTQAVYEDGELQLNAKGENAVQTFTEKTGIPVTHLITITELLRFCYTNAIPVKHVPPTSQNKEPSDSDWSPITAEEYAHCNDYLATYGNTGVVDQL